MRVLPDLQEGVSFDITEEQGEAPLSTPFMMFWREFWRREWDSNPRKDFRSLTRLAGECLKPTRPSLRTTSNYKHLFKKFKFFNLRRWENPPLYSTQKIKDEILTPPSEAQNDNLFFLSPRGAIVRRGLRS